MRQQSVIVWLVVASAIGCGDTPITSSVLDDITSAADSSGQSSDVVQSNDSSDELPPSPVSCTSDECEIGDACYANGESNPDTPCRVCRVVISRTEWTPDDSLTCDDDDPCTVDDACTDGECVGSALCDDDNPCTDDTCDEVSGECTNTPNDAPCIDDAAPCNEAMHRRGLRINQYCTTMRRRQRMHTRCMQRNLGCVYTANDGASCDDGEVCTSDDFCAGDTYWSSHKL